MFRTAALGPLLAAPGDTDRSVFALAPRRKGAQRRRLVLARSMGITSPSEAARQAATEQTAAGAPAQELHQAESEELTTLTDQQQGLPEKKHLVSYKRLAACLSERCTDACTERRRKGICK